MPRIAFLELLDRYDAEILERQRQAELDPVPEAFHQLRVHVKRARALLELVDNVAPKFRRTRSMRVFREPFRAAGTIRDLHVQLEIATSTASLSSDISTYLGMLEAREHNAVTAWLASGPRVSPDQLAAVRREVEDALARRGWVELASRSWMHFIARLRDTLAFDVHAADLHDLRKRVKDCSNLTWILAEVAPELIIAKPLTRALDKLQKQLGDWHDLDVAVATSDELPTEEPGCSSPAGWTEFRASIAAKREQLREKVLRNWRALANVTPPGV
ncbi:MAG: CHAD domain-containing protein [Acidobacteria bacterium]|nr:CHAD domain-containing protein [Acidobacteriota bacterium]